MKSESEISNPVIEHAREWQKDRPNGRCEDNESSIREMKRPE
jgi:hypothetical protein